MNKSEWLKVRTTRNNESLRDEQVSVFRMIRPLIPDEFLRGQFRALRAISGNDPCDKETRLELEAESAQTMRSAA